jgi:hypothetical protein
MRQSEASDRTARAVDWRGWLVLAWVLWFGFQYAKMVVARRGDRIRAIVATDGHRPMSERRMIKNQSADSPASRGTASRGYAK